VLDAEVVSSDTPAPSTPDDPDTEGLI
jgi:hypothetical protein